MGKNTVRITIRVSEDFTLEKAVCNHGFFMMAPNNWVPSEKALIRPLRLLDQQQTSVIASINQSSSVVTVIVHLNSEQYSYFSPEDQQFIQCQVERMLHISSEDESVAQEIYKVNPLAKQSGFARIFRAPSLFEDMVKSILLCFSSWSGSLKMVGALCNLQHKRLCTSGNSDCNCEIKEDFPSPKEIASLDLKTLTEECNLGYRASKILELAKNIENGKIKLEDFDLHDPIESHARLMKIGGFGDFAVANVMMCLGCYQYIPIDTETIKHLNQVHGIKKLKSKKAKKKAIEKIYGKYAPFQCITYWMERVQFYEKQLGKLSELPKSKYREATSLPTNIN